ncbi:MAG: DUF550 domain-containing protein, partial [Clostridia bacterium]|nr:DUF550 domain-containing protein [Clostridia bacterium]
KKKGTHAIMENQSVREHFVEEVADVFMYLFDMMESYGITAEEFSDAYVGKFRRNMGRDWVENDAMYETIPVKRLLVSLGMLESAPEQTARMVEVLGKTDVKPVLVTHLEKAAAAERLLAMDISPDAFVWVTGDMFDGLSSLFGKALDGDDPASAAVLVYTQEEVMAAAETGIPAISFASDGLGTEMTCQSLTDVPNLLAEIRCEVNDD